MSATGRFRYTMLAGATAVVIGTGLAIAGLNGHSDAVTTVNRAAEQPLATASSSRAAEPLVPLAAAVTPMASSRSASAHPTTSPSATVKTTTAAATATPTRKAAAKPTRTAAPTGGSILDQVVAHINSARAGAGLSPLTLDVQLSKASTLHNQLMINGCGLAHECSGESGIGDRFSAQGVRWTSAGENIGFGSSGTSDAAIVKAANGLTDSMLAEQPPNDGHRRNLLNAGFKHIGLSVVRDSKGVTWMTQDFVN